MTKPVPSGRFVVGLLCAIAVSTLAWLFAWITVVPVLRGWSPVAITSGSMAPGIDAGDIVIAAPPPQELRPGAVIVFDNPAGDGLLTHRIVARDPDGNYVTRGDANRRIDSTPVAPEDIEGVGKVLVPYLARPLIWVDHGQWRSLLVLFFALGSLLWLTHWSFNAHETDEGRPSDPPVPHRSRQTPRPRRALTWGIIAAAATIVSAVVLAGSSAAFGSGSASGASSLAADTLQPPTVLSAVPNAGDVDLTWTPTPDAYAEGYHIRRSTTSGCCYSLHATVTPGSATAYTDVSAGAGGTPSFETVSSAVQGPSSGTGVVVSRPAGTSDGDLLLAVVGIDNSGTSLPIIAPAGWTEIFQHGQPAGGQSALGAWYRLASSEPATYSFSWSGSEEGAAAVHRITGVDNISPIDSWALSGVTNDSSPIAPSVTTAVDDTLVLRLVGLDNNNHVEPSPLASIHPSGTTGLFEAITDPVVGSSGGTIVATASAAQASAGSTGSALFNVTGSEGWVTATISITPGAGATYFYVAESYVDGWTSASSNEASCC